MNRRINEALTKRHRSRLAVLAAAVTATALGLAGCSAGSSAASLPSSMSALVKQATTEGVVNWSAPKPKTQMQGAIDLFQKKYPGITVKYTETKAPDQVSQLRVQEAARKVAVDVAAAGELTVPPSLNFASQVNWSDYGVDAADSLFGSKMIYIWASPKVWAYNTTELSADKVPHTWNELLTTGTQGSKIAVESRGSFLTAWDVDKSMGADAGLAFAKKLAALKPHYAPNTTASEQLIESGQAAIGTSLMNLALAGKDKGVPIAIAPVTPTSTNETYIYVPKGAPHPAAAVLLSSFLSSQAAQTVLAKDYNSRIPRSTDCSAIGENVVLKTLCSAGVTWVSTGDLSNYNSLAKYFPETEKALGTFTG